MCLTYSATSKWLLEKQSQIWAEIYHIPKPACFLSLCLLEMGAHHEAQADLGTYSLPANLLPPNLPNARITVRHHHAKCNRTFLEFLLHYSHLWVLPNKPAVLEGGTSPPILSTPTLMAPRQGVINGTHSRVWDPECCVLWILTPPQTFLPCIPTNTPPVITAEPVRLQRTVCSCFSCLLCSYWLPLCPKHVIDLTTRGPLH